MAQELVKYNEGQRVDLPDFEVIIESSQEELKQTLSNLFTKRAAVIQGFNMVNGTGLKAELVRAATRIAVNKDGLLFIDSVLGANLELNLVANQTNYIEMDFVSVDAEFSLRLFFDIDLKEEFATEVYIR